MINIGIVGYYHFNIQEIIDKFCVNKYKPELNCDGKCYLSQQLGLVDDTNETESTLSFSESFIPLFIVSNSDNEHTNNKMTFNKKLTPLYSNSYSFLSHIELLDPPRLV